MVVSSVSPLLPLLLLAEVEPVVAGSLVLVRMPVSSGLVVGPEVVGLPLLPLLVAEVEPAEVSSPGSGVQAARAVRAVRAVRVRR